MNFSHEPSKNRLYFISHPLHTYGVPGVNRALVRRVERELDDMDIYYISPISIIPPNTPEPKAADKCDCLLMACDGIVLCQNWEKSKGCLHERNFAEKWELEIIEVEDEKHVHKEINSQ